MFCLLQAANQHSIRCLAVNQRNHLFASFRKRKQHILSLCLVVKSPSVTGEDEFLKRIQRAFLGGVTSVQLRDPINEINRTLQTARLLSSLAIPVIVNNRVDVAWASNAAGVHIGQDDFPYKETRDLLKSKAIIGLTVNSCDDVLRIEEQGLAVDYLGVQVFASEHTKPLTDPKYILGLQGLARIRQLTDKKIVAIGRIRKDNVRDVAEALHLHKGDGVALAGEIWRHSRPEEIAGQIRAILNETLQKQSENL